MKILIPALAMIALAIALPVRADWLYWTVDFGEAGTTSPWTDPNTTPEVWLVASTDPASGKGGTVLADKWEYDTQPMTKGGAKLEYGGTLTQLGEYGAAGYTFFVEMGAMAGQADYTSAGISYNDLVSTGFVQSGWAATDGFWNAASLAFVPTHDVPEPTGGVLVLVGAALLALRRRKRV